MLQSLKTSFLTAQNIFRGRLRRYNMDIQKMSEYSITSVETNKTFTMKDLWKEQTCVIIFFRRWGCLFCRLWAKEVSEIASTLEKNNVKLIGIGAEDIGKEDFLEGKFFDGDLYVIKEQKAYEKLGFKRIGVFSLLKDMIAKGTRNAITKGKNMNLGGDLRGDGFQNGGLIVMEKNGTILKHFVQDNPAEHLPNSVILETLKLKDPTAQNQNASGISKFEGECKMESK